MKIIVKRFKDVDDISFAWNRVSGPQHWFLHILRWLILERWPDFADQNFRFWMYLGFSASQHGMNLKRLSVSLLDWSLHHFKLIITQTKLYAPKVNLHLAPSDFKIKFFKTKVYDELFLTLFWFYVQLGYMIPFIYRHKTDIL